MSTYENEKAFLNRKLVTKTINWEVIAAVSQLCSPPLAEAEAKEIVATFKDALHRKAAIVFHKMIFTVNSKLRGGIRVIVSIPLLREFFADEIDYPSGGGGKGLTPMATQPRPPGGRGV
jgi:hypothetical protein